VFLCTHIPHSEPDAWPNTYLASFTDIASELAEGTLMESLAFAPLVRGAELAAYEEFIFPQWYVYCLYIYIRVLSIYTYAIYTYAIFTMYLLLTVYYAICTMYLLLTIYYNSLPITNFLLLTIYYLPVTYTHYVYYRDADPAVPQNIAGTPEGRGVFEICDARETGVVSDPTCVQRVNASVTREYEFFLPITQV
jgi:hypothetical protein